MACAPLGAGALHPHGALVRNTGPIFFVWLVIAGYLASCAADGMRSDNQALAGAQGTAAHSGGLVTIASGQVQGDVIEAGVLRFSKIPYAKPPIGALRWAPPSKPDAWTGVRHEVAFSAACSQAASAGSAASTNEDCLYLNVWTPDPLPSRAPVMVWIHGGGNFAGGTDDKVPTSDQFWFDGRMFAKRHGVIVVTLNYRLGPLGFFAHPGLAAAGQSVGNQGLLDQNFALRWVHDNISVFGGDPSNVTIFGESAGSSDVCHHVASPLSAGLFKQAISESGGCTTLFGSAVPPEQAQPGVQALAKALGCDLEPDSLLCLRGKPIDAIMAAATQPDPTSGDFQQAFAYPIVVDGASGFLPKTARAIFDAGEMNKVPYLLGSNSDEGTLFIQGISGPTDEASYQKQLSDRYGTFAPRVAAVYPSANFGGDFRKALAAVIGDSGLICGTHDSARRAAAGGLSVYMYNFNVPWTVGFGLLGVAHASEISHVFDLPFMADATSQKVADAMNDYWANFAKTGDPNSSTAPAVWPRFTPDAADNDKRLQLDPQFQTLDNFRKVECALWREYESSLAAATP